MAWTDLSTLTTLDSGILAWMNTLWSNVKTYIAGNGSSAPTYTMEEMATILIGVPLPYSSETVPSWALELDGSAVSRTTYSTLFALYGVTCGNGDGSTTFNLPDMRGETIRGWDHGAGNDPDAATRTDRGDGTDGDHVLTKQGDAICEHTHNLGFEAGDPGSGKYGLVVEPCAAQTPYPSYSYGVISYDGSTPNVTSESRSRNVAWMYIMAHGE